MRDIVIYPYKMKSEASILLRDALDVFSVYPDRKYAPDSNSLVVNWGNGNIPKWDGDHFVFLNRPEKVMNSINKRTSFKLFRKGKVRIPKYTIDMELANQWLDDGDWVVCRQELEGKDGSGLVLAKTEKELVSAKLYTKYIPILKEFRSYVFMDDYLDTLEKKRKTIKDADPDIRTEGRNWVFCQNPEWIPPGIQEQSILAVKSLGLDFGGVDVIWGKDEKCHVLEVNTAPGIYGTSVVKFKKAIENYAKL